MRDLLLFLIVVGMVPLILRRSWLGILVWSWLGYMNPHRLAWGFAYAFPFSQLVAVVTIVGMFVDGTRKQGIPIIPLTVVWGGFILWLNLTTLTAVYPEPAMMEWDRTMKIMLVSVLTVVLINSRERLDAFLWVVALSLGFYGLKGGVFALLTGGEFLVFGPEGSFFEDNNALALVLIMTLPVMYYLQTTLTRPILRYAMFALMALTGLSALASHSRGAFLAGAAMVGLLWLKGRYKGRTGLALLLLLPPLLLFMPAEWWERMQSIRNFQEDASAMGRINAWGFAVNLAMDKPFTGGGFQVFRREIFARYAPDPLDFHDAHSIYFEVLAEHGFVGLALFLALGLLTLHTAGRIIRLTRSRPDLLWARDLASMLQVSVAGYATGGLFLGLAYFDLYYHLIATVVILDVVVKRALEAPAPALEEAVPEEAPRAPHRGRRRTPRRTRRPGGAPARV